jgi:arylformamidase
MKVYRDFDQEALDREYRIRDTVPPAEFEAAMAAYAEISATMRERLEARLDQSFGPSADEVMDIFPAGRGAPILVYIHGGYWRMLSHKDSSFMAETFTNAGVAVAAVNYGLAPATTLDQIVRQCRRAIAWLHVNAAQFGVDPGRIHVAGSSAGGHLAAMALADGWHREHGVPDDVIAGACALSGIHDLEPIRLAEPNQWLGLDAEAAKRNSPIHHLPARGCPLIVSCGGSETSEFKRQTEAFAAAWRGKGFACHHVEMDGCNHFDLPLALCDADSALTRAVFDQIGVRAP